MSHDNLSGLKFVDWGVSQQMALTSNRLLQTKLALIITSLSISSLAQTDIEELVVTATRTNRTISSIPNTVKLLDRNAIEQQLAVSSSLLDSLSFSVPSLTPSRQKMTTTGVTLRGRTPLYMVDSIPQSTPLRNGERSGFTIDSEFVERVEVLYGANAIQGVGATGGVINYVTISAPSDGILLQRVGVELESDNFENDGLHFRTTGILGKKSGAADIVIGATFDAQDLYYDGYGNPVGADTTQGDTMDSKTKNVFTKFGYDFSDERRLEVTGNYFKLAGDGDYVGIAGDIENGIPATSTEGAPPAEPTYNEASNIAVTFTEKNLYGGNLNAQAFYYDFYALYGAGIFAALQDVAIAPVGTLVEQSALDSEKFGAKLTYSKEDSLWSGLQLVAGLDYLQDKTLQELAQTGRVWVPEMIYRGWAGLLQLEQSLVNDKLRISGGVRSEHVELDVPDFTTIASAKSTFVSGGTPSFEKTLGNFGLVYDLNEQVTLFSSYTQGFTMPDAGLILRAVNTPNQTVDALVDLQPVIADNIETGVNYKIAGFALDASYFWSDSDLGSRIQVVNGAGQIRREKTEIEGWEITTSYQFSSGLKIGTAYSNLDGRYDSDADGRVDKDLDGRNIAANRWNSFVEGSLTQQFDARLQYSKLLDRDFDGGLPQYNFEGYDLVDLIMTYDTLSAGKLTLGIQNVLAEEYITYFSQSYPATTDDNYVSGRGRVITLGWKMNL